jgi:hypothetical protein
MSEKMSTGLCQQMLDTAPFKTIFDGGFIDIYGGTPPATADAAVSGATLLCRVSNASTATGLTFEAAATGGVLAKTAAEVWTGVNVAGGDASFYRLVTPADTGASSPTEPRIQGTVGVGGADMNLGTVTLVNGATFTVNFFTQALIPS